MTAEQLEELLRDFDTGNIDYDAGHELESLAYSLARRVIAAEKLVEALKEAGDVIEFYHKFTGVDIGDISRMPFYDDTITKVDTALTAYREASE